MKKHSLLIILAVILTTMGCKEKKYTNLDDGVYAVFNTNYGDFIAKLYYKKAPLTVANFVSLAEGTNPLVSEQYQGKHFYDSLTFHRIIDGFMIQGGDPMGSGMGGPGYKFPDETNTGLKHDDKGILSMANAGPNTNGSQFFITLAPQPRLDGHYSVFGKVIKGQQVVDSIGQVEVQTPTNKPVKEVIMKTVRIVKKGKDAKNFKAGKLFKQKMDSIQQAKESQQEKLEAQINSMAKGFKKTDSGLRYKITKTVEDGEQPKAGQMVKVYYKGMLEDGTVFDKRLASEGQEPIAFKVGVGRVIPGWDEGILLLKEGEKARFIIPPYLGYGKRAVGPIPANSILIFDVTLAEVGQ